MKIQKPKGRALVIEADSAPLLSRTIRIEAHTEEARRWIEEKGKEFGDFYRDLGDVSYAICVYLAYDRDEVVNYLNALWDEDQWPKEVELSVEVESKAE